MFHLNVSCTLQAILNFQNFLDLRQFNTVKNSNDRLLDLILCNRDCKVERAADVLTSEDLHHPALVTFYNIQNNQTRNKIKHNSDFKFNFKKANFPLLYQTLFEADWEFLTHFNEVDAACDSFYRKLNTILTTCVPKKVIYKNTYPPWFTHDLINNIKLKHKAWQKYKNIGDDVSYNEFKRIRQKVKAATDVAHKNYHRRVEDNIRRDPSAFWRFVNYKRTLSDLPNNMEYKNEVISDPQIISNSFADFFQKSYSIPEATISSYNNIEDNSYLNIHHFTDDQIAVALKKLKPKLTSGPDNIPSFVVRDCLVFAKPLGIIYNLCLQTSTFPSLWKLSKIIPVFKKGRKSDITNYRPIVLINNFAKVFEMLLYEHIFSHIKHQITDFQHGFYRGRSTTTNLFCITEYLSSCIDGGLQTDIIYTDFSKAFDKLDHIILLEKLQSFGFSMNLIKFFTSYLHNRTQYVSYCGHSSVEVLSTSGVPQGSNLGPLLFNIFINDIVANLTVNCLLYADDLKLFSRILSLDDCVILQQNLDSIHNWCIKNKLLLNITKCNVLSITRKQEPITYNYSINGDILSRPETFCDLGVIFDNKLSFTTHIDNIVAKSYKTLGFVIRNSTLFNNSETLKLLYMAFVRPNLEYASIIWCPCYNVHIDNLERTQRRFLKHASYKIDGVYPAIGYPQSELLSRYSLYSLEDRRKSSYLVFLYRLIHNATDCAQILSMLNFYVHRTASRQLELFFLPTPRTNVRKYSPLYNMCNIYNDRQGDVDIFSCSLASLKAAL